MNMTFLGPNISVEQLTAGGAKTRRAAEFIFAFSLRPFAPHRLCGKLIQVIMKMTSLSIARSHQPGLAHMY